MINILIIPSEKGNSNTFSLKIADIIKQNLTEVYVSTLVSVNDYDNYYESGLIDGFIIKPTFLIDKLFLFDENHFDLAIIEGRNFIWKFACKNAKIKTILDKINSEKAESASLLKGQLEQLADENN